MKKEKQAHGGALNRPAKGETNNPNGRPRKYVSLLAKEGYALSEVNDCVRSMLAMTLPELKSVWDNSDSTILEKTIAGAMRKSLEKGNLDSIETLLNRLYGKPKESVEHKGAVKSYVVMLPDNNRGDFGQIEAESEE